MQGAKEMKWYWKIMGGHTHVRVFMNGAKCGDLVFRNEEWNQVIFHASYGRFELIEDK